MAGQFINYLGIHYMAGHSLLVYFQTSALGESDLQPRDIYMNELEDEPDDPYYHITHNQQMQDLYRRQLQTGRLNEPGQRYEAGRISANVVNNTVTPEHLALGSYPNSLEEIDCGDEESNLG